MKFNLMSWFRGLRGKLLLSAMLPLIAFFVLTAMAMQSMNKLGTMLTEVYSEVIPSMDGLGQMAMQRARTGYFIWAALDTKDDPKSREKFVTRVKEAFAEFKKYQAEYEATAFTPEEEKNYAKTRAAKAKFYEETDAIIASLEKGTPEEDAKVYKAMNFGSWHTIAIDIQAGIANNLKLYQDISAENDKLQIAERKHQAQLLYMLSAVCSLALFGILMTIAYKVSNSIGGIANGLRGAGQQVSEAIVQLTAAGQTLSQASTETAASLEETVASLEEMTSMVQLNSDHAKQAAALSISSRDAAEQGQGEIHQLLESMKEISNSSKKIEEIISVIDDIAFQTNLLALNAAVEAARAGEQGKGFAVVADAVRALAQRSAAAAKDINVLIKESVERVEKGSAIADRSEEVLSNIVNSVKKVSDLNNEIAAASTEQTTGIQQISKAMNQLDQGSQANAAGSEEVAASAEEINAQAQQMRMMVEDLGRVIMGGDDLPKATLSTPPAHQATLEKPKNNVVPFTATTKKAVPKVTAKVSPKKESEAMIPFDEDEPTEHRKVGTTDGF